MPAVLQPPPRIFPCDYYYRDFGLNWADLGVITAPPARGAVYLGNGVVIVANNRHIWRSTDFGATWIDLGIITWALNDNCGVNLGNGIALLGDAGHVIWRSIDWGITWTAVTPFVAMQWFNAMAYCGQGIVIAGDSNIHVFRSIDYGATWVDLGVIASSPISTMAYLGNGIAILGDTNGHIFRSIDYGATWADLGVIAANVSAMAYLGNHRAIFGDWNGHVFRSTDDGATWADQGVISTSQISAMAYLTEDVVIFGDRANHVFRSTDLGLTWADLGVITTNDVECMVYLDNGIALLGEANGRIFRSVSAFQIWRGRDGFDKSCRVYNTAQQGIASGVVTALTFNTVVWQTEGIWNAANPTRLTCLSAGKYWIAGANNWVHNVGGLRYIGIRINGVTYIERQVKWPLNSTWFRLSASSLWDMAIGDFAELIVQHNAGLIVATRVDGFTSPWFGMARIP